MDYVKNFSNKDDNRSSYDLSLVDPDDTDACIRDRYNIIESIGGLKSLMVLIVIILQAAVSGRQQ
ncbi:MAG: hypothetical protein ACLRWM_02150 [Streptococcus sp.]